MAKILGSIQKFSSKNWIEKIEVSYRNSKFGQHCY